MRRRTAVVRAGLVSILLAAPAAAQERPALDLRTWRPSTDPNASLVVEPAVTPGHGILTFGAYGSYAFRPITLKRAATDEVAYRPLEHSLAVDVFANLGLGRRFAVGLNVPVLAYQGGSRGLPGTISDMPTVAAAGFGDLAMSLKGSLLRNENGGFGLAALGWVTAPTGDRSGYASESGPTATARLLAEYTLLVATAQASLGYKVRTEHNTWPAPEVGGVRFGDEIPWSVGIALRPALLGIDPGNRQRLEVGVHGWLPAGPVGPFGTGRPGSAARSPVLLALSDRIELGRYRDTFVTAGVELGLTDAVGVPTFRGILGIGWSPRAHDLDGDGVKDDLDGCPEIPEDKDGFEDSDGCPEVDNDDDGIIDREDACPNVKGISSSDAKQNGCPGEAPPPPPKVEPAPPPPKEPDPDGDTYDEDDRCPDQPETFNGVDDGDGCPDEGGTPLVVAEEGRGLTLAAPLAWIGGTTAPDVDPSGVTTLRAIATELNRHPTWVLGVAVKAADPAVALARSLALVRILSTLTHRDGAAETMAWDAGTPPKKAAEGDVRFVLSVAPTPPPALP